MRRKWTNETIKTAIIAIHHSGGSLCYSNITHQERALLQAATRYFGTWEAAVNATGLNYDNCRKYRKPEPELPGEERRYRRRTTRKRPRSLFD
jgi:hypothetical protein